MFCFNFMMAYVDVKQSLAHEQTFIACVRIFLELVINQLKNFKYPFTIFHEVIIFHYEHVAGMKFIAEFHDANKIFIVIRKIFAYDFSSEPVIAADMTHTVLYCCREWEY